MPLAALRYLTIAALAAEAQAQGAAAAQDLEAHQDPHLGGPGYTAGPPARAGAAGGAHAPRTPAGFDLASPIAPDALGLAGPLRDIRLQAAFPGQRSTPQAGDVLIVTEAHTHPQRRTAYVKALQAYCEQQGLPVAVRYERELQGTHGTVPPATGESAALERSYTPEHAVWVVGNAALDDNPSEGNRLVEACNGQRDQDMASAIQALRGRHPDALVVAVMGAGHAPDVRRLLRTRGTPCGIVSTVPSAHADSESAFAADRRQFRQDTATRPGYGCNDASAHRFLPPHYRSVLEQVKQSMEAERRQVERQHTGQARHDTQKQHQRAPVRSPGHGGR
ncbi:hypothetical protein [Hydrogenophaga sp.]|uniref:hypothetical protein n=1 Tax=Hydrogenophaga sp. TaxID=1904254 RepID=UPI0026324C28|nr:hypothetical protein [Hydrogenophaga sp.]MCW5653776.1 hypothetical protein [Hydrogenophaga sp.]